MTGKIPEPLFDTLSEPLAMDMIAVFSLVEEKTFKLLDEAQKNNWTYEQLEKKIKEIL